MAPTKLASKGGILATQNGLNSMNTRTRSSVGGLKPSMKDCNKLNGKRKAGSPLKEGTAKRAAFGDITNAVVKNTLNEKDEKNVVKKLTTRTKEISVLKVIKQKCNENFPPAAVKTLKSRTVKGNLLLDNKSSKIAVKENKPSANQAGIKIISVVQPLTNHNAKLPQANKHQPTFKLQRSSEEPSEPSLYISANDNTETSSESKSEDSKSAATSEENSLERDFCRIVRLPTTSAPEGVVDFDREQWKDPLQVSCYAADIFRYLKGREQRFRVQDYMPRQPGLTGWMRALLVDWMVEVQESFELNHETLYLAVKLVDLFLCREAAAKEQLQLVGAASLFVAAKYDERVPPLVEDFLYICDGAYTLKQLLRMEIHILKTIGYDLGIPLSYRFLRRYARCAHASMPTLTLARFVLELCLMEYAVVVLSDSKMAAAALYLALRMKGISGWTPTLVHYSGYSLEDILPVARIQNTYLHKKPKRLPSAPCAINTHTKSSLKWPRSPSSTTHNYNFVGIRP